MEKATQGHRVFGISCYLNHPTHSMGHCYVSPAYEPRYMENYPSSDVLQQDCGMFGAGLYKGCEEAKANTSQEMHL